MAQPVVTPSGLSFDRYASRATFLVGKPSIGNPTISTVCRGNIVQWIDRFGTDPATNSPLSCSQLYPNLALRDLIQGFVVQHRDKLDPELLRRVSKDCVGAQTPIVRQRSDGSLLPLLPIASEQQHSMNGLPSASFMIGRHSSMGGEPQVSGFTSADVGGFETGCIDSIAIDTTKLSP